MEKKDIKGKKKKLSSKISQQRLHSIQFELLKNIRNVNISFEPKNVTGIFGVNGCGKSTILHAISCLYKPTYNDPGREDYKFSAYFTPTTHSIWRGSKFKIIHSFRKDKDLKEDEERVYKKDHNRWKPRYVNRPERDVYFIGIDTTVPDIEREKQTAKINLTTNNLKDNISKIILKSVSYILNTKYMEYHNHTNKRKSYIGVKDSNGIDYSSLYMGAGEQRLFRILKVIYEARKYSLIVIDEIDLTIHTDALNRLIEVISKVANDNDIQIVFTSHREELLKLKDSINIRHIYNQEDNTICFENTNPDCIKRLTGVMKKDLEIFVEDDISEGVINGLLSELNMCKNCSVVMYGSIENSFVLASGIVMQNKKDHFDNIKIILDGDKYQSDEEKTEQIKKHLTGTEEDIMERRGIALGLLRQYKLPRDNNPERYIHSQLKRSNEDNEIISAAKEINYENENHKYIDRIITDLDYKREIGIFKIIEEFKKCEGWIDFTKDVREWLEDRKRKLNL